MQNLLGVLLFSIILFGTSLSTEAIEYVICKDSEGVLIQTKGDRIVIDGDSVFVYNDGVVTEIVVGIQCWTADETVVPKGKDDE